VRVELASGGDENPRPASRRRLNFEVLSIAPGLNEWGGASNAPNEEERSGSLVPHVAPAVLSSTGDRTTLTEWGDNGIPEQSPNESKDEYFLRVIGPLCSVAFTISGNIRPFWVDTANLIIKDCPRYSESVTFNHWEVYRELRRFVNNQRDVFSSVMTCLACMTDMSNVEEFPGHGLLYVVKCKRHTMCMECYSNWVQQGINLNCPNYQRSLNSYEERQLTPSNPMKLRCPARCNVDYSGETMTVPLTRTPSTGETKLCTEFVSSDSVTGEWFSRHAFYVVNSRLRGAKLAMGFDRSFSYPNIMRADWLATILGSTRETNPAYA